MSATVEEIADDVQDLNVQDFDAADDSGADVHASDKVASRAERKSRKALQGIGLKKVGGITRVTMRRPRGHLYVIAQPEVYKSSKADVYIVFGEAKAEDMSQLAQAQAAQQMAQAEAQERLLSESLQAGSGKKVEEEQEDDDDDDDSPIDEEGVDAKDIDLVMQQVNCSRRKAVKALKESNGDLINAIMNAS